VEFSSSHPLDSGHALARKQRINRSKKKPLLNRQYTYRTKYERTGKPDDAFQNIFINLQSTNADDELQHSNQRRRGAEMYF